jgi:hypothetical protein
MKDARQLIKLAVFVVLIAVCVCVWVNAGIPHVFVRGSA